MELSLDYLTLQTCTSANSSWKHGSFAEQSLKDEAMKSIITLVLPFADYWIAFIGIGKKIL